MSEPMSRLRRRRVLIENGLRERSIYLLPNLFTTAALFAGFYAIVQSMNCRLHLLRLCRAAPGALQPQARRERQALFPGFAQSGGGCLAGRLGLGGLRQRHRRYRGFLWLAADEMAGLGHYDFRRPVHGQRYAFL